MILTNEELKNIYFGAYEFEETGDGIFRHFSIQKSRLNILRVLLKCGMKDARHRQPKPLNLQLWQQRFPLIINSYGNAHLIRLNLW